MLDQGVMSVPSSQRRPLISVIVASFNYDDYIEHTLRSILDQTEKNLEIVVVDDASTDRSREIIESFADRRISLFVNDRNLGSSPSYNRGAAAARGDYITYVDADDWISPRKFELQVKYFEHHTETDILGTYVKFHRADGARHAKADAFERSFNQPHDFNSVGRWIRGNRLAAPSVMFRRTVHDRIGLRDPAMISIMDAGNACRAELCRAAGPATSLSGSRPIREHEKIASG
jgi:glycosyltransferase involved in cell wall biosynthesis